MASENPQEYYEDITQHGNYVYVTLEEMVTNFLLNYTGDGTALGNVKRYQVLLNFKKGIQQFSFDALKEVKAIELELGDAHDIILPPDYVNYVRISWINEKTGELMPMSINNDAPMGTSYMQDNNFEILFDSQGEIVEGTTMFDQINDQPKKAALLNCGVSCAGCQYYTNGCLNTPLWGLNSTKNNNGTFNINTRQGRIHFSSENVSKVIMLEYISDGLEYSNESDIKVNKFAEIALYSYVNYNLIRVKDQIQEYKILRAKKDYDTSYRNAKIKLMNLRPSDMFHALNSKKQWIH